MSSHVPLEVRVQQRRGVSAFVLGALERLYITGQRIDAARKRRRARRLAVPVVSIGNVTVGGTGKTPTTVAICKWLQSAGRTPAILSRGYGAKQGEANDEYRVLARRLPEVPHEQGTDRHQAGSALLATHPDVDVIVLDDGFQHYALERDVDLVVIDATRPFGFGRCLPRGLLREPLAGLERASGFIVTRSERVSDHTRSILLSYLRDFHREKPVWEARSRHGDPRPVDGGASGASLREQPVFGFCGIGNPAAFEADLRSLGARVVGFRPFADHHAYTAADLEAVRRAAQAAGADRIVCTEKDAVKLEGGSAGPTDGVEWIPLELELNGPPADVLGGPFLGVAKESAQ